MSNEYDRLNFKTIIDTAFVQRSINSEIQCWKHFDRANINYFSF